MESQEWVATEQTLWFRDPHEEQYELKNAEARERERQEDRRRRALAKKLMREYEIAHKRELRQEDDARAILELVEEAEEFSPPLLLASFRKRRLIDRRPSLQLLFVRAFDNYFFTYGGRATPVKPCSDGYFPDFQAWIESEEGQDV